MKIKVKNNDDCGKLKNPRKIKKKKIQLNEKQKIALKTKNRSKFRRNRKYRKLKVALMYTMVILVAISIGVIFSIETLFKVKNIEVVGTTAYSNEEIIEASEISKGLNMFMSNINISDSLIENKLPFIKKATLKKKLPSTIQIIVEPAVSVGAIECEGRYIILDKDSKVLEVSESCYNLPSFFGIELDNFEVANIASYKNDNILEYVKEISTAFQENSIFNITSIDFTDLMSVCVLYDGRIKIKLGDPIDLTYKIDSVCRLFNEDYVVNYGNGELDVSLVKENNKIYFNPVVDM